MIAVILYGILSRQGSDFSLLLSCAVCCMLLICAAGYLKPVIEFLQTLAKFAALDQEILTVVLKAAGVGLIGELASHICSDSGNAALGKGIRFLLASVILWLCVPLLTQLLQLLQQITEAL